MKSVRLKIVIINLVVVVLLLALLEGFASILLSAREAAKYHSREFVAESVHTRFDPLLGWINLPDIRIENMYGTGAYLATNTQGFRNEVDIPAETTLGTRRVLCLGDSFTMGYGVSNIETWCHLLSEFLPGVETVNMGQGGYGVDQAYLRYRRDGTPLQHDLVLFAFITGDFYRMQVDYFIGYFKPVLRLTEGRLEVIPPHETSGPHSSASGSRISAFMGQLRIVNLLEKLAWIIPLLGAHDKVLPLAYQDVTEAMFAEMKQLTDTHAAQLLLVHLPDANDIAPNPPTDGLRQTLARLAERQGIGYIDLVDSVRQLPSAFDAEGLYQYGHQHYNIAGNRFIAQQLKARIADILEDGQTHTGAAGK